MAKRKWKEVTTEERLKMKEFASKANPETVLSDEYAASYLNKSPAFLAKMRCENSDGIPFIRIGKRGVGYIKRDLQNYVQANQYTSTAQYA